MGLSHMAFGCLQSMDVDGFWRIMQAALDKADAHSPHHHDKTGAVK